MFNVLQIDISHGEQDLWLAEKLENTRSLVVV